MVKAHDAMKVGAADVQGVGDRPQRRVWHIAKGRLNVMQEGQQSPSAITMALYDDGDIADIGPGYR